jgi:hypothetical protein
MSDVILAAIVGGIFGAGGAVIGVVVSWRQDVGRRERAAAAEREGRVRAARMRDLEQTRTYLIGNLEGLSAFVQLGDASGLSRDNGDSNRSNINLVGDAKVIREYTELLRDLSERLPMRWRDGLRWWRPRTLSEIDPDELGRVARVSSNVLKALDEQEARALRDEDLKTLTDEEIASLPGAEAILDVLRRRANRH